MSSSATRHNQPSQLDREQCESAAARWYREHASTVRGLLSLLVVGIVWEIAGRSGQWPLVLAAISEIWVKFLHPASSGGLASRVAFQAVSRFCL
ncbi:MAG TPA: hypothetical protein VKV73_27190, partial [Chloroflexota bacterium]|nr:hypothetical protein [Chloroflexota bacterium]